MNSAIQLVVWSKSKFTAITSGNLKHDFQMGTIVQWVVSLTADPGVVSSNQAPSNTFVEIDREIISTVIFLLLLIQEGLLSVTSKSMYMKYWF